MFLTRRFYWLMMVVILVTASGFAVASLFVIGKVLMLLLVLALAVDVWMLWSRQGMTAMRLMSERFSNGDDNDVRILLESTYGFPVGIEVIDEIPFVFQRRDVCFKASLEKRGEATVKYQLRPTHRGVYGFGRVRVFVNTNISLVQRR